MADAAGMMYSIYITPFFVLMLCHNIKLDILYIVAVVFNGITDTLCAFYDYVFEGTLSE